MTSLFVFILTAQTNLLSNLLVTFEYFFVRQKNLIFIKISFFIRFLQRHFFFSSSTLFNLFVIPWGDIIKMNLEFLYAYDVVKVINQRNAILELDSV